MGLFDNFSGKLPGEQKEELSTAEQEKKDLEMVQKDGMTLGFVKEQTPEICLAAVKQNGEALVYVKERTHEICLAAVQQTVKALLYVKEQTPEICLAAVQQDGMSLVMDHKHN